VIYLLDSSAFAAFFFQEKGSNQVQELLFSAEAQVNLSVLSVAELSILFKHRLPPADCAQAMEMLPNLFDSFFPVTEEIVHAMLNLRDKTSARLPIVDALISATATIHQATFVHRDKHFSSIPARFLKQIYSG
jgi:predicted nucleic acid-binding protein